MTSPAFSIGNEHGINTNAIFSRTEVHKKNQNTTIDKSVMVKAKHLFTFGITAYHLKRLVISDNLIPVYEIGAVSCNSLERCSISLTYKSVSISHTGT